MGNQNNDIKPKQGLSSMLKRVGASLRKTARKVKVSTEKNVHIYSKKAHIFFLALGHKSYQNMVLFKEWTLHAIKHAVAVKLISALKTLGLFLLTPFIAIKNKVSAQIQKTKTTFKNIKATFASTKNMPVHKKIATVAVDFARGVKNRTHMFTTAVNYALPVLAIYFFVSVVSHAATVTYLVQIDYNGENLGYVQDEYVIEAAKQMVSDRMIYLDDSERIDLTPSYSIKIADKNDKITEFELADKLISLSNQDMIEADGLYVDGKFLGAVADLGEIENALDTVIDKFRKDETDANAAYKFTKDVEIVTGLYIIENIVDTNATVKMLTGNTQGEVFHTVSGDDTLSGIASEYGLPWDTIYELNPDVVPELMHDGDKVLVSREVPFLSVEMTKNIVYDETIKFDTVTTESNEYTTNVKKTVTEGVDGKNQITAEVTYIDGIETNREIISTQVVTKPVTEEIIQGTAPLVVEKPSTGSSGGSSSSSGGSSSSGSSGSSSGGASVNVGFQWPMNDFYISSSYGWRFGGSDFHSGIDLARWGGAYGASIYSAGDGTVISSTYRSDYGNLIKVSHGSGLETWYAHCSAVYVSAGDKVSAGDLIGAVGSTGYVTGPHLHFEVWVNGSRLNPLNYLP